MFVLQIILFILFIYLLQLLFIAIFYRSQAQTTRIQYEECKYKYTTRANEDIRDYRLGKYINIHINYILLKEIYFLMGSVV